MSLSWVFSTWDTAQLLWMGGWVDGHMGGEGSPCEAAQGRGGPGDGGGGCRLGLVHALLPEGRADHCPCALSPGPAPGAWPCGWQMFAEEEAELTQETSSEKLQQYRQVHLLPGLQEQGWCEITARLLALPEHDAREKVLQTLGALLATCRDHYRQDPQLRRTLASLQAEYQALAALELQDGEAEGYFRELLGSVSSLLAELR